jgi:hypothetical protein
MFAPYALCYSAETMGHKVAMLGPAKLYQLASTSSESLQSHKMAPLRGRVACPIFAMREMILALCVFGLLERASDMDAPRALMLVSSALQK